MPANRSQDGDPRSRQGPRRSPLVLPNPLLGLFSADLLHCILCFYLVRFAHSISRLILFNKYLYYLRQNFYIARLLVFFQDIILIYSAYKY